MTPYERVFRTLSATGVPGAHQAYAEGEAPPPPFFIYKLDSAGEVYADDRAHAALPVFYAELYERAMDAELEARFRAAIEAEFGPCSVNDHWIASEGARMVSYRFTAYSTETE